tara:strand:- start:23 stop:1081 length:1059 start_codon:yes stop_codon:yes gene_type:complete
MNFLKVPKKNKIKFVLLGSGKPLCDLCDLLIKNKFVKPIIVTHPKRFHKRDEKLLSHSKTYSSVFEYSKKNNIELIQAEKVNDAKLIMLLCKKKCSAAFSISCRSIIKKPFLDAFNGLVFNIHPAYLPEERGGAIISWRILNNKKYVAATLHQIDEGIDSGPIIIQKKKKLNIRNPFLEDYILQTNDLYIKLFSIFIQKLGSKLELKSQNQKRASYYSRLYTEINGAIDWNWSNVEIESFINAFGSPYPGAFTFLNNKKISILEGKSEKSNEQFHPFLYGRIIQKFQDDSVRVVTKKGFLRIKKIAINGTITSPSEILQLGNILYTPSEVLHESKTKITNVRNMKAKFENKK